MTVDLRTQRLNRGRSIPQMAGDIGIPAHVYRRVENTGQMPYPANALKIASFFGVTVTAMWPEHAEPSSRATA